MTSNTWHKVQITDKIVTIWQDTAITSQNQIDNLYVIQEHKNRLEDISKISAQVKTFQYFVLLSSQNRINLDFYRKIYLS